MSLDMHCKSLLLGSASVCSGRGARVSCAVAHSEDEVCKSSSRGWGFPWYLQQASQPFLCTKSCGMFAMLCIWILFHVSWDVSGASCTTVALGSTWLFPPPVWIRLGYFRDWFRLIGPLMKLACVACLCVPYPELVCHSGTRVVLVCLVCVVILTPQATLCCRGVHAWPLRVNFLCGAAGASAPVGSPCTVSQAATVCGTYTLHTALSFAGNLACSLLVVAVCGLLCACSQRHSMSWGFVVGTCHSSTSVLSASSLVLLRLTAQPGSKSTTRPLCCFLLLRELALRSCLCHAVGPGIISLCYDTITVTKLLQ